MCEFIPRILTATYRGVEQKISTPTPTQRWQLSFGAL